MRTSNSTMKMCTGKVYIIKRKILLFSKLRCFVHIAEVFVKSRSLSQVLRSLAIKWVLALRRYWPAADLVKKSVLNKKIFL